MSRQSKTFQPSQCDVPDISLKSKVNNGLKTTSAPIDFFNLFCDDNFFVQTCQVTKIYNVQQSRDGLMEAVAKYNKRRTLFKRLKSVMVSEIKQIIAIILYTGICKLPNWWMYWGSRTTVPIISESMNRNHFEDSVSILHFNENKKVIVEGQDAHNKLHKILPLTDHFKTVFSNIAIPETYQAIDDMMVPRSQNVYAKEVCQV